MLSCLVSVNSYVVVMLLSDAQDVTVLHGSTVSLACRPPSPTYDGFFEWRFYRSQAGVQIYSYPPFRFSEEQFPPTRYRRLDEYGLEISTVEWRDGGVYGCHFLSTDDLQFSTVVVIGECCELCDGILAWYVL